MSPRSKRNPDATPVSLRSARSLFGWGAGLGVAAQFAIAAAQTPPPATPPNQCTLGQYPPVMTTQLTEYMSWFSKPMPNSDWVAYIGNGNRLVRQDQPSVLITIPGGIDPVPSPDGRYVTVPMGSMYWYRTTDLFQTGLNAPDRDASDIAPAWRETDGALGGVYQSVGVLPGSTPQDTTYRLITESPSGDRSLIRMRTLRVKQPDPSIPEVFTPVGPVVTVCPGIRIKTPILSKDGLEMSAYATDTRSTKIYRVQDDGSCSEVVDLGIPTGKLDFSFDGNRLAFHMDQYDTSEEGDWFSGISSYVTKNVFVAELDRSATPVRVSRIIPVTQHKNKGDGSYYPGFRRDGKLVYMTSQAITGGRGYSVSLVDLDGATTHQPYLAGPGGYQGPEVSAKAAIGALWIGACTAQGTALRAEDALLYALSLDPEGCRLLVEQSWEQNRERIIASLGAAGIGTGNRGRPLAELTKTDLLAACPTARPAARETRVYGVATPSRRTVPKEIFDANCRDCHMAHSPNGTIDFDRIPLYLLDEMIDRVGRPRGDPDRMPRADMDADERTILLEHLQQLRSEILQEGLAK